MKILWFDIESTGVNVYKNDIIEFACLVEIDYKIVDKKVWQMQPISYEHVSDEALEITGKTLNEIKSYEPAPATFMEMISFFNKYIDKYDKKDKFYPAGYNVIKFDLPMLKNFFFKNNHKYFGSYFNYSCIDVYPLAVAHQYYYKHEFRPENFKLITVAETLGVDFSEEKLHGALYDIEITRQIFLEISKNLHDFDIGKCTTNIEPEPVDDGFTDISETKDVEEDDGFFEDLDEDDDFVVNETDNVKKDKSDNIDEKDDDFEDFSDF